MARPSSGQVVERHGKRGKVYAIRYRANGERVYETLGTAPGWNQQRAKQELDNRLAAIRVGVWKPPRAEAPPAPQEEPTFHEYASGWLAGKSQEGLSERTVEDYQWALTLHLLPFFAPLRLSEITPSRVKQFARFKVDEGVLCANSVNKVLGRLAMILADAFDEELISSNPAAGRRRRLKGTKPARRYLDRAEQITALLDAARELDAEARPDRRHVGRCAFVSTLTFAGLRISEATGLRWRDVDLASGRLFVEGTKTDAARRTVPLLPPLRDELAAWKARSARTGPTDFVFATARGTRLGVDNARHRIFDKAVERANERLLGEELAPLPEITPHGLRRTYASLRVAVGDDPVAIARAIGHADAAGMTLKVYAQMMDEGEAARGQLRALVTGTQWAPMGTGEPENTESATPAGSALEGHPA